MKLPVGNESYEKLLTRSNKVSIYQTYLRALATEVHKSLADINPEFMKPCFIIKEMPFSYVLRQFPRINSGLF